MKHVLLIVFILSALTITGASAQKLPPQFNYTIYIKGEHAGTSQTTVTKAGDRYVFETQTKTVIEGYTLDMKTRTELDQKTFHVRELSYRGTKNGEPVEGDVVIEGETVTGYTVEKAQQYPFERVSAFPTVLVLEDYVIDHEAIIARICSQQEKETENYGMLLPSSTMMTKAKVSKVSELAFESEIKEAICTKLVISIEGSSPFVSYYDPELGLPVYLAFPASATEVFLDAFFGDNPDSRYRPQ